MPLYICNYCDYNSKIKKHYYRHLHKHLTFENISNIDPNEMELCMFYYNKLKEQHTSYYQNNKDKIKEQRSEYYQNNKDKVKKRNVLYRLRKKIEKLNQL